MIPRSADWKNALANAIRDPAELLDLLELPQGLLEPAREAARGFPLRVPRGFVARMRKGDPEDPLLRQVWARGEELLTLPLFSDDPVGDRAAGRAPGLLHKYQGRALLVTTGACAVHCRYCFRRHFPYGEENAGRDEWRSAMAVLAKDRSIHEIILSGGDPLMLDDARLAHLVGELEAIPHLTRLRLHTRVPVVLPQRVDAPLLAWLKATRLQKVIVVHANHAQEIDADVTEAFARLRTTGATLLNQSVLLRGVNDDAQVLSDLSETLFSAGVLPYYLHLLDKVRGAAHFDVPEDRAAELLNAIRIALPGYLVPKLVREIQGRAFKTPVEIAHVGY
jgi:EF-P beta-lysylation protein EpmB